MLSNRFISRIQGGGLDQQVLGLVGWDRVAYPIRVTKAGSTWSTDFDRSDYVPDSMFVTTYYVDFATGSDENNGTTTGTKLKSIHAAITKGNATSQPYKVIVTAGTYPRANSLSSGGAVVPTQSCAVVATGGRVITGNFDDLSWPGSTDATYTNTYKVARSNVAGVYDRLNNDAYGDMVELTRVADAATCNTTPGSWTQVGSDLYVRRTDGAAVTNTNTRAILKVAQFTLGSGFNGKRIYLNGLDMEGSTDGATMYLNGITDIVAIAEDCSFKYAGAPADAIYSDAVAINDSSGLLVLRDCIVAKSAKDGVNAHFHAEGARQTFVLTERVTARNLGKGSSTSNNGLTGHENLTMLDVDSEWTYGRGGVVRCIDDCHLGAFGSAARHDLGDGVGAKICWHAAADNVRYYLVDCEGEASSGSDYAIAVDTASAIYTRNFTTTAGLLQGNILPF